MNRFRTWPHLAMIGLLFLVLAAGAAALWVRHEQTVEASALPNAARIDRVSGEVGLNRGLDNNASNTQWVNAEQNTPISVGDRIYTKDNSDASVAFTGRNFARLDPNTSLDVLSLSEEKTQLALRDGSAVFDIGNLPSSDLFEVATPCGAVDLTGPGLYQVEINDNGSAMAAALSGAAQLVGQGGTGRIEKGEVLTVPCQGSSGAMLSRIEPGAAGTLVDRYYRDRYPRTYDGRYVSYDSYLNDPYYYDPYRRFTSYQYVSDYIPGVYDLDDYGDWQDVSGYGYGWHPRVDYGWAPYQSGYWITDYPYGLTWISNEPWGYAPYHYGRWAYVGNSWFWIPDRVSTTPVYSPALVAFVPFQTDAIGWVPLAPGDPYAPRYYDQNWTPRYLTQTQVIQERVVNLNVPGAVTIVNVRDFNRVIDRRTIERVDAQQLAHVRPVLDPFAVRNFRDAAMRTREAQRRLDVPAAVAQRIDRPVITSTMPVTPFRRDLAQRFHAQPVSEKARGERLQFKDNRASTAAQTQPAAQTNNTAAEQARERQMADLSREAARGNRVARQQMQQLQQQQRQAQQQQREQAAAQQRAERMAAQQAQGERIRNDVQTRRGVDQRQPQPQARPRGGYVRPPIKEQAPQKTAPPPARAQPQPRTVQPQPPQAVRPQPQPRTVRPQPPPHAAKPEQQPRVARPQPPPQAAKTKVQMPQQQTQPSQRVEQQQQKQQPQSPSQQKKKERQRPPS